MSLESERRAIGTAIEAERRGSGNQIASDLDRLSGVTRKLTALSLLPPKGTLEAKKGVGTWDPANVPSTGGGIASPLSETDYTVREYWPKGLLSSDGLFNIPALKTLKMTDNDGAEVILNFAQPVTASTP